MGNARFTTAALQPYTKVIPAEYDETRTGDLISRVTSDIDAVQDFVNSALLGILVNSLTLVGMIGVMFYINWRFTLIALSVSPVLFVFVYFFTRRIKNIFMRGTQEGKRTDLRSAGSLYFHPRGESFCA